jgi:hypothetical protein
MQRPEAEKPPQYGPNPENRQSRTESLNTAYVHEEAVGDTTVHPMGPEIPRDWPRPQPRQPKLPD